MLKVLLSFFNLEQMKKLEEADREKREMEEAVGGVTKRKDSQPGRFRTGRHVGDMCCQSVYNYRFGDSVLVWR